MGPSRSVCYLLVILFLCFQLGCGAPPAPPAIIQQPVSQAVVEGQAVSFSVAAVGPAPLKYQWWRNGAPVEGATSASYTIAAATMADDLTEFQVSVSNAFGQSMSTTAALSVGLLQDVTTFHNDNMRTGQYLTETYLTPRNVNVNSFGKVGFLAVDGRVDAQPLFLANVSIAGQNPQNVLYVATEHDSVYAFDAGTQALLWQASLIGAGETSSDDGGCFAVTPEIGITATPVIDRKSGPNGAIYLVTATEDSQGQYHPRLHALDISTGAELFGGPTEIQAQYPGTGANSNGSNVIFDPAQYLERPALLLLNGIVYTSWASHCDYDPYTGWVIGYDESTLRQASLINLTPNGSQGAIWMAGAGPAADESGNIFLLDGNGSFDQDLDANGFPGQGDFGNAFIKLSTNSGPLAVADYFATSDTVAQSAADTDLGSGGALVLPDLKDESGQVKHLALGTGKDGNIYVVDRDNMGKFNPSVNDIYQELPRATSSPGALLNGVTSTPAYFNSTMYFGADGDNLRAFTISGAKLSSTPAAMSEYVFPYPGVTPSISANGNDLGILWAVENASTAVLHAYDAGNLNTELYNSNLAGTRDQFGAGNKFIVPTVADGKVYLGTPNGVAVFGLLPGKNSAHQATAIQRPASPGRANIPKIK
ncbi:MAG: immunoglobulin domain-containing protein [Candidatus Sulfotelmatobacter sp.]